MAAKQWSGGSSAADAGLDPDAFGDFAKAPYLYGVFETPSGVGTPDSKVLRGYFDRKGYGTKNTLVIADTWYASGEEGTRHAAALFRLRNTTGEAIDWPVSVFMTASGSLGETRSIIVGGTETAPDSGDYDSSDCAKGTSVRIPPSDTEVTVIFVAGSGPGYEVSSTLPLSARNLCLGFFNNCLELPAGLEYVDDLRVATADYVRD